MTQIPDRDWDRLSPDGRALIVLLAGLREGRTVKQMAERLAVVVDGVLGHIDVNEKGVASGPKGTVTLTLTVGPNRHDASGNTVEVREDLRAKWPEDREHVVYVGRGSTLHTRQSTMDMLFDVESTGPDGSAVFRTVAEDDTAIGSSGRDAAAGPDA